MTRSSVAARTPIAHVTMPLFRTEEGEAGVCATGVLLQVKSKHFILTAAHIFDAHHWRSRPIPLSITDGVVGHSLFPIGEVILRRSPTADPVKRLADDSFDSCVIDLSRETAARITAGGKFRFLTPTELDPWSEQDPRDWFTVAGFPSELAPEETTPGMLGSALCPYTTFLYCGERDAIPWTDADAGVGILMDHGQFTTQDDSGQLVTPPYPGGMSGGGMWRVAQYGCEMSAWELVDVKLIGIQSAYYPDQQVLRGTRIEHHLGCVYRGHEDLRLKFDEQFGPTARKRWLV